MALRIGFQRDHRLDQRKLDDLEASREQRQQRYLHLEPLGLDHLRRLAPRCVGE